MVTQVAAGMGQDAVGLAWIALIGMAMLCGTVVTLVFATAKRDRLAAIRQLVPILERLADKIFFRGGGRRK